MSRIDELAEKRFGRGKLSCPDDIEGPAFEAGARAVLEECRKTTAESIINDYDWCDHRGDLERKLLGFGSDAEVEKLIEWLMHEAKGFILYGVQMKDDAIEALFEEGEDR